MASWEHAALKVWALLKPFLLQNTVKSSVHGGLCPVATPGRVEMKLCPFALFCGLFVVSFYEFP